MNKNKVCWLLMSLVIFLSLSCLSTGIQPGDQDALETVVASTLTAVAGEASAPIETSVPDVPAPVETVVPDVPAFTAPRALQVAYIKDGNVYIWTEGESSVRLTNTGDAMDVRISDDGQIIAYMRRDPNNDFSYELWAVKTSGPTNTRVLVSYAELEALNAASPYPAENGLRPEFIEWRPGTHQLAYSTLPMFLGPGYAPGEDMRVIDADTLEKTTIFDFDQGGIFYYSPDGNQVALANPDHISIANANGSNLRANVLTFSNVITYSEYGYYPHPYWTADSSALRVAIPPSDPLATPLAPTTLWHIPSDGSPATQLGSISVGTVFSPDLNRVVYVKSIGETAEELHIANADSSEDFVYATGEDVRFWQWTPDSTRFMYAINGGAEIGIYLGQLSGGSTLIANVPTTLDQVHWVDSSRFLYIQPNGVVWELRISDMDGSNHAFIDTFPSSSGSFDFTQ